MKPWMAVKVAIAHWLCRPIVGRVLSHLLGEELRSHGLFVTAPATLVDDETRASLFWGFYESAELRLVRRHLRVNTDVVELGSSLGVVSACIAQKLTAGRRLICVEANPALLPVLEANVRRNAPSAGVTVVHAAISYQVGPTVGLALGRRSLDSCVASERRNGQVVRVPALTLAALLRQGQIRDYALVCDIEGAEAALFRFDRSALDDCHQIIVELHDTVLEGTPLPAADLRQQLQVQGFSLKDHSGAVCVFERRQGLDGAAIPPLRPSA